MVVLERDVFGEKPLYYSVGGDGTVLHGDSVLDLLRRGVPRRLSRDGLMSYLSYGAVQTPLTLVEGVKMVPPGCRVEIENGLEKVERYWTPSFEPEIKTAAEAQEKVTELVRASVKSFLAADSQGRLPAAFLSGGIDSGAIVAVMRQLTDGEIRTYCVRHDDDKTEESHWAKMVADKNGTKHTTLHLSGEMIRKHLLEAVESYDQPTLDGVNFWFASKLVKEAGEETVLSGEGGDELFAGYDRFAKHMLAYRWNSRFRKLGSSLWGRAVGGCVQRLAGSEKVRKLGELMAIGKDDPYVLPRKVFGAGVIQSLLKPELRVEPRNYLSEVTEGLAPDASDLINRISWFELNTVTPDLWLRDGYQTSRHHGLRILTPLLSRSLAELLFKIPGAFKVCDDFLKPLLVRAAGEGFPVECATRTKMGFILPFDRYFGGELKQMMDEFLFGGGSLLFDDVSLDKLGRAYRQGHVSWSRVWALFVVEHWCRKNGLKG